MSFIPHIFCYGIYNTQLCLSDVLGRYFCGTGAEFFMCSECRRHSSHKDFNSIILCQLKKKILLVFTICSRRSNCSSNIRHYCYSPALFENVQTPLALHYRKMSAEGTGCRETTRQGSRQLDQICCQIYECAEITLFLVDFKCILSHTIYLLSASLGLHKNSYECS